MNAPVGVGARLRLDTGAVIESDGEVYEAGACVRVLRPDGTEAGYWTADEWRDDPEAVMGAILLCAQRCHRGIAVPRDIRDVPSADWRPSYQKRERSGFRAALRDREGRLVWVSLFHVHRRRTAISEALVELAQLSGVRP